MVEKILKKIEELQQENAQLWDIFYKAEEEGHSIYYHEDYGGDFCAGGYDGDSLSHMFDILQEQNYILDKLVKYINDEKISD